MNRLIQLTTLKSLFHEIIAGKLTGLGFDSVQGEHFAHDFDTVIDASAARASLLFGPLNAR